MQRLQLKSPRHWDWLNIYNGKLAQSIVDWRFSMTWEALTFLNTVQANSIASNAPIADICRIVGAYSTLWIDSCKGTIAPMDVQPCGWTWPNGEAFADEYWWQWTPDVTSEQTLLTEANSATADLNGLMGSYTRILKPGVPFQLERRQGTTIAIDAIPLHRLAAIVRPDCTWTFEFEISKSPTL